MLNSSSDPEPIYTDFLVLLAPSLVPLFPRLPPIPSPLSSSSPSPFSGTVVPLQTCSCSARHRRGAYPLPHVAEPSQHRYSRKWQALLRPGGCLARAVKNTQMPESWSC
jgi:hypothetical protein